MSDEFSTTDLNRTELPPDHRSGFVAVIGRPNVGKSTLLNRLLGQKIAITSPKPQTTRDQILGIVTRSDAQFLFLDTPGIHRPLHKLGEHMVAVATETIKDADVALWLVDGNTPPTDEEHAIGDLLRRLRRQPLPPLVLGINQIDAGAATRRSAERIQAYLALVDWLADDAAGGRSPLAVAVQRAGGCGRDELLALLRSLLPLGPRYYAADEVTDVEMRFIVAELDPRESAAAAATGSAPQHRGGRR